MAAKGVEWENGIGGSERQSSLSTQPANNQRNQPEKYKNVFSLNPTFNELETSTPKDQKVFPLNPTCEQPKKATWKDKNVFSLNPNGTELKKSTWKDKKVFSFNSTCKQPKELNLKRIKGINLKRTKEIHLKNQKGLLSWPNLQTTKEIKDRKSYMDCADKEISFYVLQWLVYI